MSDPTRANGQRLTLTEDDTAQLFESLDQALTGGGEKGKKKVQKSLGKKIGISAGMLTLLTALVAAVGPRVHFSIGDPPSAKSDKVASAPEAEAPRADDGITYATQAALDATARRLADLDRCPIVKSPPAVEVRPGVEDPTCRRLREIEERQLLIAQALSAFNRGSLGPNWEVQKLGQFELQPNPPPVFKTDSIYPGNPSR